MNLLKKLWNFLFGKKEEESTVEEAVEEATEESDLNKIYDPEETGQHCGSHIRFRKTCPDCLRAVGVI